MLSCVQIINHLHEDLNQHVFLCKLPTGNCRSHHDNTSQPLSTAGFNGEGGTDSPGSAADGRAQQSGWRSTETAAPNYWEQNRCPVITGDSGGRGLWWVVFSCLRCLISKARLHF